MANVVAQPHFIFGLRAGVRNNLGFFDEQTLVFPSGNNCVCHNTIQASQRFLPGSEKSQGMCALALSANRRYLAVSERGERSTITVLDLHHEQGRKRKVLTAGDLPAQEFVCMAFSPDSKYLIGQTGPPEWTLIFWLWEKHKVLATVKTSSSNNPVNQVSFNPFNNTQLCVSGTGVFKLFRYTEGFLKQSSASKVESINFLSHCWMAPERVVAGTDTGRLLVFESGELRREMVMSAPAHPGRADRQAEMKRIKASDAGENPLARRVTSVLSYSRGLVCSLGSGRVCLFVKNEDDSFTRSREIWIPSDPFSKELGPSDSQDIETMCMSPSEETLAVSTDRGQLYSISLSAVDVKQEESAYFDLLSQSFHSKAITGLSICIRKPIVATSSLDRCVRIWNYETKTVDLCKEFQEEAHSVALHPTALFVLVGFSDKLRLMNILVNDIRIFKEFTVRGCRQCAFSNGGHMFAAVDGNIIHIYSFTSFENVLNLKGHSGKVRGVEWSPDDGRLVSCGLDGAVYEWNTHTGKRVSECVLKSCSYTDVVFSSDLKTILAVGTDRTLKEIQDCQVLREVSADEGTFTSVAVSHSGRVVFTGNANGTISAIKYPLPIQKEWITYQAHGGPLTKMMVTFDEQFLLTVSEDGCLLMWKLLDKDGRGLKGTRQIVHAEEILVTKADLEETNQNMMEMKLRLEELHMEHEYQLRLKVMSYNEKIRELSDKLTQQTETMETLKQTTTTQMEKREREHQQSSAEVAVKHSKELKDLEVSYSQKLVVEHTRYQDLQQKYQRMEEDYGNQLKAAEAGRLQSLEELKQVYEAQLEEKSQQLTECQEESHRHSRWFKQIVKAVEQEEQRKIHMIGTEFENKLHAEKETNKNLKGEVGVITQNLYSLQRQLDDRRSDVNNLKQERQSLLGLVRSLKSDIEDLRRQISGHEKTNQDKDNTISNLKKKNQDLEKLRFVLDCQLEDLRKQIEPQQEDVRKKKEHIQQLEEELLQVDKINTQLQLSASDLRLKLRAKEEEIRKEVQKVKDLETHLQRLQSDLHTCVSFIQEPKKLKESVQTIFSRRVPQAGRVEKSSMDEDVKQILCRHREHLEKTVSSLKMKLAKSAEEHDKVYVKLMKENVTLITEINELRKELLSLRTSLKPPPGTTKKSNKRRPKSADVH
eukprot:XP_011615376.1 PREDICTED: LOW QUALITY PROTEIN: cilia- and flagella-associated protein 57 [Takifugu rubripes]